MGLRAGLDGCGEENIFPLPGVEHGTAQPVTTTPLMLVWLDLWGLLLESPRCVNCLNSEITFVRAAVSQCCTYACAAAIAVLSCWTLRRRYPKYSIIIFIEPYAEMAISLESVSLFSALGLNVHGGSNPIIWQNGI